MFLCKFARGKIPSKHCHTMTNSIFSMLMMLSLYCNLCSRLHSSSLFWLIGQLDCQVDCIRLKTIVFFFRARFNGFAHCGCLADELRSATSEKTRVTWSTNLCYLSCFKLSKKNAWNLLYYISITRFKYLFFFSQTKYFKTNKI